MEDGLIVVQILDEPGWPAAWPFKPENFRRYDETPDSAFYDKSVILVVTAAVLMQRHACCCGDDSLSPFYDRPDRPLHTWFWRAPACVHARMRSSWLAHGTHEAVAPHPPPP